MKTALCCVGLTLVVTLLDLPKVDALRPMEHWLYDRRCRYCQFFNPPPTDKLVHLDIDDSSLDSLGQWPWPRSRMALILDEIRSYGPKAVAMDILYSEPHEEDRDETTLAAAATSSPLAATMPTVGPATQPSGTPDVQDATLARSIRQLNNVILGASLKLDTSPSSLEPAMRDLLARDLEFTPGELLERVKALGFRDRDLASKVAELFTDARKEAAQLRVAQELGKADATKKRPPTVAELQRTLLHKTTALSPQGRAVEAGYRAALARRAARRFSMDIPLGLPRLAHGVKPLLPIPAFSDAAAAEGFVDYPPYKDGHVRSVPLFMEFDGRMVPQIALVLAARMLDAKPSDIRVTADAVTIVGKGNRGSDVVIPVRTLIPEGGGQPIPLTMDIPWIGTSDWEHMLPGRPHLSLDKVYEVIHFRNKLAENNRIVDRAVDFLLSDWDEDHGTGRGPQFRAKLFPAEDFGVRLEWVNLALKDYDDPKSDYFVPEGADPASETDPKAKRTIAAVNDLRAARREQKDLESEYKDHQAELKSILHDRAILIGWAATAAIADRKPTSIHPEAPGVVVHGTIFNGIMQGHMWRTLPTGATIVTTLVLGILVTAFVSLMPPMRGLAAAFVLAGAFLVVNGIVLFDRYNLMLGIAGPLMVMAMVWAGGTVIRAVLERRERARITARFASYVDPELVEFVLENENQDVFKGAEREMTVVFNDLAGFTALTERLGKQIIPVLNEFMDLATRVIKQHHGYVNKFLGDGVMFFFNAPRPRDDYAGEAVQAVLELQQMVEQFNLRLAERGLPPLSLRTGVTTGLMFVGDAGSAERADYTVLGDLVNLASRLESANKAVGTSNLMTDRTIELAGDRFLFRPVGQIQVVGLTSGVMVYEAIAPMESATPAQKRMVALSAVMVDASLDSRPADCLETIIRIEEEFGDSRLTQLYRDKCEGYLGGQTAGDFDRQIVLTQKG